MDNWKSFRTAYHHIDDAMQRCIKSGSSHSLSQVDAYEYALDELKDAFRHCHVVSDDDDTCALCGLNIHNDIHIRG